MAGKLARCTLKWNRFPVHISPRFMKAAPNNIESPLESVLADGAEGAIFDGSGFGGPALVACAPAEILEGSWNDWEKLERALHDGRRHPGDGGLAGWFDYAGSFRFGVFPEWHAISAKIPAAAASAVGLEFSPGMECADWMARVQKARDYIAAGDIYQVNLTHTMTAPWRGDAGSFYGRLREVSPAPFSCFLRLGDTEVLSASPECFLSIDGRRIVTRPIKGTRPRLLHPAADATLVSELLASPKERAELIMITDLERNDLGQVCQYGSVHVTSLCALESFAQVHHLVSTVEGELRPEITPVQAVRACYPGGSITGAPKKRAREIIAELEPVPRGIYTGALGFFRWDGRAVFNIAIRTLVIRAGHASYGVGAGIVADSDPALEYEETLHKAAGLRAALFSSPPQGKIPKT
jgi:aminodeoxychorismate synthase component I